MLTLALLLVGAIAGVASGLFGIGGGVVMVLLLRSVLGMPFLKATGTSLAAMLLPVGILAVREYHRAGHLDLRAAGLLAAGLLLGAWGGARIANEMVTPVALQKGFAVFLALMAVRMWVKA